MALSRTLLEVNVSKRRAVYAGSFDPMTFGHLDIVTRGSELFDELIVAVGENPKKRYTLSLDERVGIIDSATSHLSNVSITTFQGLLVDFCQSNKANVILRGLRAVTDFEFEFQIGLANMDMAPQIETVFLLSEPKNIFISSSLIKEIAINGGSVSKYLPAAAEQALLKCYSKD